jgi:hypothetical protein
MALRIIFISFATVRPANAGVLLAQSVGVAQGALVGSCPRSSAFTGSEMVIGVFFHVFESPLQPSNQDVEPNAKLTERGWTLRWRWRRLRHLIISSGWMRHRSTERPARDRQSTAPEP